MVVSVNSHQHFPPVSFLFLLLLASCQARGVTSTSFFCSQLDDVLSIVTALEDGVYLKPGKADPGSK